MLIEPINTKLKYINDGHTYLTKRLDIEDREKTDSTAAATKPQKPCLHSHTGKKNKYSGICSFFITGLAMHKRIACTSTVVLHYHGDEGLIKCIIMSLIMTIRQILRRQGLEC